MNGVIEILTGDLLRHGYGVDFANDGALVVELEAVRTDLPVPPYRRGQLGCQQMHRWDGSAWILVDQPAP